MSRMCILALALGFMLAGGAARAQQLPDASANTVQVSAEGQFKADPDTAMVQMDITGQNANLKTAYAQAQAQAEQVRTLLLQQGFTPEQAHWSSYSVQPNLDYKTRKVTDYTVSTALQLETTDFAKLGPLLQAFGAAGLNALRGVSFELKNMAAAKSKAIADGYRQTRQEADALALAAGRRILALSYASVDVSSSVPMPQIRMLAQAGMAAVPAPTEQFTPRQITVTARVSAVYRMNP